MGRAIGYFLTWTTYGTRLHGDERGSVDDAHNRYGTPRLEPDPRRERVERDAMVSGAVVLSAAMRSVVVEVIHAHAVVRGWRVWAAAARTNHVHVVVSCSETEPETVIGQYKAWGTRRLRERGLAGAKARVWTPKGSTRYLFTPDDIGGAAVYVAEFQDRPERFVREARDAAAVRWMKEETRRQRGG